MLSNSVNSVTSQQMEWCNGFGKSFDVSAKIKNNIKNYEK